MVRNNIAYLIEENQKKDKHGIWHKSEKKRKIYCNVGSVSANEWFQGGRNGLNPELRLSMFAFDYCGEQICEYNGIQYTIYRIYYKDTDEVELYLQLKKGNADGEENQSN